MSKPIIFEMSILQDRYKVKGKTRVSKLSSYKKELSCDVNMFFFTTVVLLPKTLRKM